MATSFASKDNEKSPPRKILSKKFHFRAKKDKRPAKMKSFTPFFQKITIGFWNFMSRKSPRKAEEQRCGGEGGVS